MKIHLKRDAGLGYTLCGLRDRYALKTISVNDKHKRANGSLCNNCTRVVRAHRWNVRVLNYAVPARHTHDKDGDA
jgi:hypothetical protein